MNAGRPTGPNQLDPLPPELRRVKWVLLCIVDSKNPTSGVRCNFNSLFAASK
jgi:hypothetical protein